MNQEVICVAEAIDANQRVEEAHEAAELCKKVVERLQYKPGTVMKVAVWGVRVVLFLNFRVQNLEDHAKPFRVTSRTYFPIARILLCGEEAIIEHISGAIQSFELHEMNEWLKLDGKCVVEPHPELKKDLPFLDGERRRFEEKNS